METNNLLEQTEKSITGVMKNIEADKTGLNHSTLSSYLKTLLETRDKLLKEKS